MSASADQSSVSDSASSWLLAVMTRTTVWSSTARPMHFQSPWPAGLAGTPSDADVGQRAISNPAAIIELGAPSMMFDWKPTSRP